MSKAQKRFLLSSNADARPPRRDTSAAGGFRAGLEALLPELRGRAFRLARSEASADDLVQDTLERALRFAAQYEPGTNLRAWVHQILFSVFISRCRRARRELRALGALTVDPCAWTLPERTASPEARLPLSRPVRTQLEALPPSFRDVLELVDLGDLTYREAAQKLGVPLGTVMSRLHRGRRMLAAHVTLAA